MRDRVRSLFHVPLNFGRVMRRNMQATEAADAGGAVRLVAWPTLVVLLAACAASGGTAAEPDPRTVAPDAEQAIAELLLKDMRLELHPVQLLLVAADESGAPVPGAVATVELVAHPPYPAGPQRLSLPVSMILGEKDIALYCVVTAPGYEPQELFLPIIPGFHTHAFRLAREAEVGGE